MAATAEDVLDPEALSSGQRARLLKQLERLRQHGDAAMEMDVFLHLGGAEGEDVPLPADFSRVIMKALAEVAAGRRVRIAAADEELTTQETTNLLGISPLSR